MYQLTLIIPEETVLALNVKPEQLRQDLADSTAWVRGVRENEWSKSHD